MKNTDLQDAFIRGFILGASIFILLGVIMLVVLLHSINNTLQTLM